MTTAQTAERISPRADEALVWRVRLLAVCVALAAVAFRQKPGLVVADTKLDLTQDPWRFLGKSLHLWDPSGAFGQLQNQAYGYLFPMGPFHGILLSAGVPPWVTQRLWWTLLLCTAFLGMWRVLGALGTASAWFRLVGSVTFALCPRICSELTVTSIEVWPMAVAPWVLWPLIAPGCRSWRWRVCWSALALACCGGVNAVATGATMILPTVWFLTRRVDRHVVLAFAGWLGACFAAIAWWLVPLVVLGRYSPPFLDWIEGASVTTSTASGYESFKGTSAWLGFLSSPTGPQWPGGWLYVTSPTLIVASTLIASLGLGGVLLRRTPERVFLVGSIVVGLVLLTAGHTGPMSAPWSEVVQDALDRGLSAFRNAHKFDVVLRLPLTVGLVGALTFVAERARELGIRKWAVPLVTVSTIVVVAAPALVANLARSEAYVSVPRYWAQTARWLDSRPEAGAALVLPAASFSDFTWGSTKDNPLQALMRRPLVVRDAVPLGSAGATRFLDGVQREVGAGRGGEGLARALAVAGVRFVVVPNDLRLDAAGSPLAAVHSSLQQSGLDRVAYFGPAAGNQFETDTHTVDYRTLVARPSVEVYEVPQTAQARAKPLADVVSGVAGPEDAAALQDAGVELALLGTDAVPAQGDAAPSVVTDGMRRREVEFGRPVDNTSHVLTRDEPMRQKRAVSDFVSDPVAPQTVTTWSGVRGVSASSSASDAGSSLRLGVAFDPGAALDGDPATRWVSGTYGSAVGEWWQVNVSPTTKVRRLRAIVSTASPVGAKPRELEIRTASGSRRLAVAKDETTVDLTLPPGRTSWIRITLTRVWPGAANGFSLTDVYLDDLQPREGLLVPSVPNIDHAPDGIVLRRDPPGRSGCLTSSGISMCSPDLSQDGEGPLQLRRELELPEAASYSWSGTVVARGRGADALLDLPGLVTVSASSRLVDSPGDRPGAAFDGDVETGWVAGQLDLHPQLTLKLPGRRTLSGVQFLRGSHLAAAMPREVRVRVDDGHPVEGVVDSEGYLRFPAQSGRQVVIEFLSSRPFVNVDSRSGVRSFVPVGFSEVRLLGADDLRQGLPSDARVGMPCGFGPALEVNGVAIPTRVAGSATDLEADRPLRWEACGNRRVDLATGDNLLVAQPSVEFAPDQLVLVRSDRKISGGKRLEVSPSEPVRISRPSPDVLTAQLGHTATPRVLAVAQNFNEGWRAEVRGRTLAPVRVNGWMQGWVVPADLSGTVTARFLPDRPYRAALGLGAVALLALFGVAIGAGRGRDSRRSVASLGPGPVLTVVLCGGSGLALAGWWGMALALGSAVGALTLRRRTTANRTMTLWPSLGVTAALVAAAPLGAAGLDAAAPWPAARGAVEAWWSQALIALPVLLTVLTVLLWAASGRPDSAHAQGIRGRARADDPIG